MSPVQQQQLLLLLLLLCPRASVSLELAHRCEPISVEVCQNIGYNRTMKLPSVAQLLDQRDAELTLNSFIPLIQYKCSANLKFFLCSVFTPMCDPKWEKPIGPCRPLCQSVRRRCYPILKNFGFTWPSFLNCSLFPARNTRDHMCMEGSPEFDDAAGGGGGGDVTNGKGGLGGLGDRGGGRGGGAGGAAGAGGAGGRGADDLERSLREYRRTVSAGDFSPDCGHLRNSELYVYLNHTGDCALGCHAHDLFGDEDKRLAQVWMGVLAALCAASSLATILTFLIDRSRFKYPVRPVVFMSLCYLCYSLSYFVRLVAGREAAACDTDPVSGRRILIRQGLDNTNCAVVFLLQYFFSTAASAWYVILVLTWLLQAGWKWSPEAVARRSCYFHLPAWIVPVCLTVCVLIVRQVEADELFGLCNVGSQNRDTLLKFVIVPSAVFLLLEAVFLVAGLVAMSRVRRHAKSDGQLTYKFDVLMGKIGLFSALYIIPTAAIAGFNVYEYAGRDYWHLPGRSYHPSVAAFLVKAFASLAIGLTTILWICSSKTAVSWRNFFLPSSRRAPASYPKTAYQVGLADQAPGSPNWPKQPNSSTAHLVNGDKTHTCSTKSHHHQHQHQQPSRCPDSTYL